MALTTSLNSYWKLDESSGNAADATGNGNTVTNTNTVTYGPGKINNGATFAKASTQYFTILDASQTGLDLATDFAFQCWIKVAAAPATDEEFIVVGKYASAGNQRSYAMSYLNESGTKNLRLLVSSNGSAVADLKVANTLTTGSFQHFIVSYKASTGVATFYINGSSVGTATGGPSGVFNSTARFCIGAYDNGAAPQPAALMDGSLDEIGVWARELTSGDVTTLYNGGAGLAYPFATSQNSNFLMFMGQ